MATILKVATRMGRGDDRLDDTITDRLNHVTTTAILVVMAVLVSTKQYVGSPIQCWPPKEFTDNHADYTDSVCWIKGTYYVPFDTENMPSKVEGGRRPTVTYYQWVPLILLAQAFLFSVPCMLWRNAQSKSGFDVENFIEFGRKISSPKVKNDVRGTILDHMTMQLERYLKYGSLKDKAPVASWTISIKQLFSSTCFRCFSHRRLNYFLLLQLAVKFLYLANCVGQIFLLDYLLGMQFHNYGSDILISLMWGRGRGPWWQNKGATEMLKRHQNLRFPKVTMCDFQVRRLGAVHNYSIQCALTVNLFNEKVFLILWFWMVFMSFINALSLIRWTLRNTLKGDRYRYIKNLLLISGLIELHKKNNNGKYKPLYRESVFSSVDYNTNNNINNQHKDRRSSSVSNESKNANISKYHSSKKEQLMPISEESMDHSNGISSRQFERVLLLAFVRNYLGPDGVFLLHLLNQATDTIVVMETVERLWVNFREHYESGCRSRAY